MNKCQCVALEEAHDRAYLDQCPGRCIGLEGHALDSYFITPLGIEADGGYHKVAERFEFFLRSGLPFGFSAGVCDHYAIDEYRDADAPDGASLTNGLAANLRIVIVDAFAAFGARTLARIVRTRIAIR